MHRWTYLRKARRECGGHIDDGTLSEFEARVNITLLGRIYERSRCQVRERAVKVEEFVKTRQGIRV